MDNLLQSYIQTPEVEKDTFNQSFISAVQDWSNPETKQNETFINMTESLCNTLRPHNFPGFDWIPDGIKLVGRSTSSFMSIYMFILLIVSFFLNGLVILATFKYKALRQPINYIIVNLAVADWLSGLFSGIIVTLTSAKGYFYLGKVFCYIEGFAISVFSLVGINSIAIMAFERFLVICKPFGPSKVGKGHAVIGVVVSWVYSIIWNSIALFLPNGITVEAIGVNCAPNWLSSVKSVKLFLVFYFAFCFMVPLSIIVVCYSTVILTLRKISKSNSLSGSKNPEGDVAKMVIIMVSAFLIAWVPYAVVTMCIVAKPDLSLSAFSQMIPSFFAKSSLVYNPVIYIGLNRQFRDCVIRMFFGGRNPWAPDDVVASSHVTSQVTTVSTNKIAPAM